MRWIPTGICVALVAITWLVFGPTLRYEFVNFDDHRYVYENPQVSRGLTAEGVGWAFTNQVSSNWHPLTVISHMLDARLFGLNPGGHHFTNVLLHTVAVLLLFRFLHLATGSVWRSAFVAAIFAIHPLRAESVAWISERKDVLSGVFFMLTLLAYRRYAMQSTSGRYVVVALLFACGLMSKPMLVTMPLVLLLVDYWPLQREVALRKLILEKLPLLALSAAAAVVTVLMQSKVLGTFETLSLGRRIGNAALSCLIYIGQLFWPVKLAAFYPHPMDLLTPAVIAVSFLVLGGLTVAAVLLARSRRYIGVGWFWYVIMLTPVLGIVQVGLQAHADRYTYLPQIGLYVLAVWTVAELSQKWPYRRPIIAVTGAAILLALGVRASSQAATWRDSETLWRHAIAVTRYNYVAHESLARLLWSKKRVAEAIPHFQQALAINRDDVEMHNTIGLGLLQLGRPSEGIAHWQKALEIDPSDPNSQSNLAWVYATCPEPSMRDGARAVEMARSVIERSPAKTPILLRTLAAAYAETGRFDEAISVTQEAVPLAKAKGDSSLAAALQANISDYRLGLPLRDSSLANVRPISLP